MARAVIYITVLRAVPIHTLKILRSHRHKGCAADYNLTTMGVAGERHRNIMGKRVSINQDDEPINGKRFRWNIG